MFLPFLTLSLLLLPFAPWASAQYIDPPTNPNSTIQSFSFSRQLSWTNQDFDVVDNNKNGTKVIKIETHLENKFSLSFALDLTLLPSSEKLGVTINARLVHCGFKQTYKIWEGSKNMYQFLIDPRGAAIDRWHIKKFGNLTHAYTWERHLRSLTGVVKSDDNRKVAYFKTKTWGSEVLASVMHSKFPQLSLYTITTNGEVPLEVLVALFASAVVRRDGCNW